MQTITAPQAVTPRLRAKTWALRLVLASLLLFASEILLWIDPPSRTIGEWALLAVGYTALSTLVLDLAARYRIRTVYEAMLVFAIYGLGVGFLLNPETTFTDFPRTLATRAIGAHSLLGLQIFGLFLVLIAGHMPRYRRLLFGGSLWIGFYWGIWVRWSPSLINWVPGEIPLPRMLIYGLGALLIALVLLAFAARRERDMRPEHLILSPAGFGVLVIVFIVLLIIQLLGNTIPLLALPFALTIIAVCVATLWFQRSKRGFTVMDRHFPPNALSYVWVTVSLVLFFGMAAFAYELPLLDIYGYNQLSFVEFTFALVGFGWFPLVMLVIGGRAIDRQIRTRQL